MSLQLWLRCRQHSQHSQHSRLTKCLLRPCVQQLGDDVSAHATSAAHADTGLFTVAGAASRGASAAAFDAIAGAVKEAFGEQRARSLAEYFC